MNLTFDTIKESMEDSEIYLKGEQLYNDNKIVSFDIDKTFDTNIYLVNASILDNNTYYEVNIAINKNDDTITGSSCNCDSNICSHIIAVLLKVKDNLVSNVDMDAPVKMEQSLINLVKTYEDKIIYTSLANSYTMGVNIEAMMTLKLGCYINLSFKVGNNKAYKIKNLRNFIDAIKTRENVTYGNDLSFVHDINNFNMQARRIINFISEHLDDNLYYNDILPTDNASITLKKESVESFKALSLDKITFINDNIVSSLEIKYENPHLVLNINSIDDDSYSMSLLDYNYNIIKGFKSNIILYKNMLYCTSENFSDNTTQLLLYFLQNKEPLLIDKKYLAKLYTSIILTIEGDIEVVGDINEFILPTLNIKVYIDAVNQDTISTKLIFDYDGKMFNGLINIDSYNSRNYAQEHTIISILRNYLTRIDQKEGIGYIEHSIDKIYDFINNGLHILRNKVEIYTSKNFAKFKVKESSSFSLGVRIENNLLEIDINNDEYDINELKNILTAYRLKKDYYRLKDGSFVSLKDSLLQELSYVLDSLHIKTTQIEKHMKLPKYHALTFDKALNDTNLLFTSRQDSFKQVLKDIRTVTDSSYQVPDNLKNILRNYQKKGFRWLKTMSTYGFGGILADDMGIGKTIQVIALLQSHIIDNPNSINLVVCPTSLILNWEQEIDKFSDNIKTLIVSGTAQLRNKLISKSSEYNVIITSYDYLRKDYDKYKELEIDYFILDEAQYIKNHQTINAMSAKQINSKYKFALTGTPIENSLSELWSIFDFLMPNYLYTYDEFKQDFEIPIVKEKDQIALEELKKLVEPFILRRLKKDVLKELPEKVENTITINLNAKAKEIYTANRLSMYNELLNSGENRIMILSMLTKLRQICCDPQLVYSDFSETSSKVEASLELINRAKNSNKKVLLFSQFTSIFPILEQEFKRNNISFFKLTGSTSKIERSRLVSCFQNDDTNVFLISLKAGGTGLNLTSAEVVIHFDPWWNLSTQNQATDRAYRLGQHNNLQVYKLICKDTIEEKIMKLQELKSELSESIINSNQGVLTSMNKQDLLDLFK